MGGAKSRPLVSIIIPVFNTEQYLGECLESLRSQTLEGIEIICVDNGSTDDSPVILRDYEKRCKNLVVLSHPEGRQGDARNAGLSIATGKYVGFVDSDDLCDPDMFSCLYTRAEETGTDVMICNIRTFRDSRKEESSVSIDPKHLHEDDVFVISDRPALLRNLTICNRLFRRSFLEEQALEFPEGLWHEDQFFVGKALLAADRIATVPNCLYNYRKGREGSVGAHVGERNLDVFAVMELLFDYVSSSLDSKARNLAQEVKVVRYLSLYPSCGSRVKRNYYERMRAEFFEMALPAKVQFLKRSEMREVRAACGCGGYLAYTIFLAVRRLYGTMRRATRILS